MELVAVENDKTTCGCCVVGIECVGNGTYNISSNLQSFVFINGKSVIVNDQSFDAYWTAATKPESSIFFIDGKPVVLAGCVVERPSCDNCDPVVVSNQTFVRSD